MDYSNATVILKNAASIEHTNPETALTDAISVYRELAVEVKDLETLQKNAKMIIANVMRETGQIKTVTSSGTAYFANDSERVTWNGDALDALCASSAELRSILWPHRTVKTVVGGLTIKG
jgi:hypothetical protein